MRRLRGWILGFPVFTLASAVGGTSLAYTFPRQGARSTIHGWWTYVQSPSAEWDPAGFLALLAAVALPLFLATSVARAQAPEGDGEESARTIALELLTLVSCLTASVLAWCCVPSAASATGLPLLNGAGATALALLFAVLTALAAPSEALIRRTVSKQARDARMLAEGVVQIRDRLGLAGPQVHAVRSQLRRQWSFCFATSAACALVTNAVTGMALWLHTGLLRPAALLLAVLWQVLAPAALLRVRLELHLVQRVGRGVLRAIYFVVMLSVGALLISLGALLQFLQERWFLGCFTVGAFLLAPCLTYLLLRRSRRYLLLMLHMMQTRLRIIRASAEPDHPAAAFF